MKIIMGRKRQMQEGEAYRAGSDVVETTLKEEEKVWLLSGKGKPG